MLMDVSGLQILRDDRLNLIERLGRNSIVVDLIRIQKKAFEQGQGDY